MPGFSLQPIDAALLDDFEAAANESISGSGRIGEAVGAEAVRGDEPPVALIAFTFDADEPGTEDELLAAVMRDIAATQGGTWEQGAGGQAFVLETASGTSAITKWADEPFPLYLFATGEPDAPVEEVVEALLAEVS